MAQLVIAAAGASLGGALFGPGALLLGLSGAQLGWIGGSLLASAFSPTQKSSGPRLGDLSVSGSAYGTPIPYTAGHPRLAGQIIWASAKREIATTQRQGKGGGGSEYTSYTYEVDLLLVLADNPIGGVTRIWRDGKLVWTGLGTVESAMASGGTPGWTRLTVYGGGPSQLPDPTYEAAVGTANAPAYRGRGTVFIEGLQLGSGGDLTNLTFEIGNSIAGNVALLAQFNSPGEYIFGGVNGDKVLTTFSNVPSDVGPNFTVEAQGRLGNLQTESGSGVTSGSVIAGDASLRLYRTTITGSGSIEYCAAFVNLTSAFAAAGDFTVELIHNPLDITPGGGSYASGSNAEILYAGDQIAAGTWCINNYFTGTGRGYQFLLNGVTGGVSLASGNVSMVSGPIRIAVTRAGLVYRLFANGVQVASFTASIVLPLIGTGRLTLGAFLSGGPPLYLWTGMQGAGVYDGLMIVNGAALYTGTYAPAANEYAASTTITLASLAPATLSNVVSDICLRCGLTAGQFDVTGLASITRPVRALAISQVSSARSVLEILAATYFFEAVSSDKIYFKARGGASTATILYSDLGVVAGGTTSPDPLPLRQANELEIPAQIALTYSNSDSDYQADTQLSDRLLTSQESTSAISVPLSFTASEAKSIVDAMLLDKATAALTTTISLGLDFAKHEPTDVLVLTGEDGSQYRVRVIKKTEAAGVITLDAVLDDASVLVQAGVTVGGQVAQTVVLGVARASFHLLDIPLLRDEDDRPGHYVAVSAKDANWKGAAIYSSDDDISYSLNTTISEATITGQCTSPAGPWTGGNVFDETNTVTVDVGVSGELVSVTRDQILGDATLNAAALVGGFNVVSAVANNRPLEDGFHSTVEIIQYRTATLIGPGKYVLSGLLRGRRGTEWASGRVLETFVALSTKGMRFLPKTASDIGQLVYCKVVSSSQKLSVVTAKKQRFRDTAQRCLSVVDLRVNKDTSNFVFTWKRRSRVNTRVGGASGTFVPLDQSAERYRVFVFTASDFNTIVPRTLKLEVTAASWTYTAADMTADFGGPPATFYLRIVQIGDIAGMGELYQPTSGLHFDLMPWIPKFIV